MFDVGFSEVVLLLVIGLLVLGPERLPRVARTLGAYVRKARNSWAQVKYDIDRELQASEMRQHWRESMDEARKDLDAMRGQVDSEIKTVDDEIKQLDQAAQDEARQLNQQLRAPASDGAQGTSESSSRTQTTAAAAGTVVSPPRERSDEQA